MDIKWSWDCLAFVPGATTVNLYLRSLFLLGVVIAQTYGAIYDQVSQLPTDVYDYIIVGGKFPHTTNPRNKLNRDHYQVGPLEM